MKTKTGIKIKNNLKITIMITLRIQEMTADDIKMIHSYF